MGTRHLVIVYYGGKLQICQYGHYGGEPSRQGSVMLEFLRDAVNVQKLTTALNKAMTMSREEYTAWVRSNAKAWDEAIKNGSVKEELPDQDRISDTQSAQILRVVAEAIEPLEEADPEHLTFLCDIQCEWAYVVDLDEPTFEVYSEEDMGDRSMLDDDWRWPGLKIDGIFERRVDLAAHWHLDCLPTIEAFRKHFAHLPGS